MTQRPAIPFAQAEPATGGALLWSAILIIALILLFGAIVVYRKWMNAEDSTTGEGFTLSDLRKLHKEGKMTTEEFERAKTILIGSLKAKAVEAEQKGEAGKGPRTSAPGFDVLPPDN